MNAFQEITRLFPDCASHGLTSSLVLDSRSRFGSNLLTPLPTVPVWLRFLEKFNEPIIKILLAAAILSFFIELFQASTLMYAWIGLGAFALIFLGAFSFTSTRPLAPAGLAFFSFPLIILGIAAGHASLEGIAVMLAVILATGVAFLSEWKSDREFEKLNQARLNIIVKLFRDGVVTTLPLDQIVVGDLLLLETGDELAADGVILSSNNLEIDQSLLTGESEPVEKSPGDIPTAPAGPEDPAGVYRGTQVIAGVGKCLVLATGDQTMIGQIASHLGSQSSAPLGARVQGKLSSHQASTPLQEKLGVLATQISRAGYIASVAIFLTLAARGIWFTTPAEIFIPANLSDALVVLNNLVRYFMYMVIIIVVAVPEGLPMSVTISLALAMRKMTKANSLVRQMVACETIGSATVICSDKTGTLTQNRMVVDGLIDSQGTFTPGNHPAMMIQSPPMGNTCTTPLQWIALNAGINSTAHLDSNGLGVGNSTESSLLAWLKRSGIDYRDLRSSHPILNQNSFSSERKWMDTTILQGDRQVQLAKGAPEALLEQCTHHMTPTGAILPLDDSLRPIIQESISNAAKMGSRILGLAKRDTPDTPSTQGFILLGFITIRDPLRPDVAQAVEACRTAGIQVIMITGDNTHTARAIAREAGLQVEADSEILTSQSIARMTDEELSTRLKDCHVLARAKPLDKFRIIRLLQENGQVVAVTGDGTNDAPALKRADVGLAMGISGTEVAKEASKIVILDDAFSTIVKAVLWGRALYENIQKFLQFQLTINLSALVLAFLGPFMGIRPPFTVLQLLWINVIMDSFAAIALCSEEPDPSLLNQKPKRRNESILSKGMVWNISATGLFMVLVMAGLLLGMKHLQWFAGSQGPRYDWEFSPLNTHQVTIFFSGYVLMQMWNMINCRSLQTSQGVFRGIFKNKAFFGIMGLILLGQVTIVQFGYQIFKVSPLSPGDWLLLTGFTSLILVFGIINRTVRKLFQGTP